MRDPIELEIFKNIYHSIAEEMGAALRRTAFSPNIKERRDYSCAVFDPDGEVIAMGDHMPVHLGSMPMSVRAAVEAFSLEPGDMVMLNDPFRGGTHLPDITLVAPVHMWRGRPRPRKAGNFPDFYVASRAHHADVGGAYPGSMGLCREIYQEGLRIPPVRIVRAGKMDRDILALLLNNVRTPDEREGDLGAQIAACHTGAERLREVCARYGLQRTHQAARELLDYSEEMMREFLKRVPPGSYRAEDFLDNDGISEKPVKLAVAITFDRARGRGRPPHVSIVTVDFTGSDPQVEGSVNAVEAITYSACFYVFRCFLKEDVPATAGLMRPIHLIAPPGTVVNNLTIGGLDPRTGEPFAYYETIAGGMGARPSKPGVSGVHTHMTNSLNTPAEALEYAYPLRVRRYSLRPNSGGKGQYAGGEGIVREIEVLIDAEVTLLSERRTRGPWGLSGGKDGAPGKAFVVRQNGSTQELPGKFNVRLRKGERIRIESPGGGGWGRP